MVINDRAIRGLVAGIIAGIAMAIVNIIFVLAGISKLLYANWASVYLLSYIDNSWLGLTIGQLGHLLFSGFNGIIFVVLVTEQKYYKLKGILFGLVIWFASNTIAVLFKINSLLHKDIQTIILQAFSAALYGWVLSFCGILLEEKKQKRN